ncbi:MuF-C-terminal domain-containing protein [Riemerella columbipharyngis]|uniref:Eco57I restriction-modification methylase n=1 Tax=Riemerella columbipharyngis TaxID=1071918 RepID=A0A1G6ZCR1_9FLAO|nr:helicase-related protein [Riemerella columbipharyngis]SDE00380.1 Eco57I restriction-modification methylase [Riemerella columbipharyngis]
MNRLSNEDIQRITESLSVLDYFLYLEKQGKVNFDRKTGHDYYFITENNKFSVTDSSYYDFKTGEGGKIIKAVMQLENKSWKEAVDFLKNFSGIEREMSFNAEKEKIEKEHKENGGKIKKQFTTIPNNEKLLAYFESRGIDRDILKANTEQVHYKIGDKKYFGIGVKNESGGYEIRSPYMKSKIGNDISVIKGTKNELVVFEGMTDMLSFLQLAKERNKPNNRTLVVLNSVTNVDKFLDKYKDYSGKINLVLDGDKVGEEATQKIKDYFKQTNVIDLRQRFNINENGYPDLNAVLIGFVKQKESTNTKGIQEKNNINSVNEQFNTDLQKLKENTLPKGYILQLGYPNEILQSTGIPDLPIEMNAVRLREKSQQDNHPFELSEVENLPDAIQNPIAVFESSTIFGRRVIFTELQHKEKNFVAVLELEKINKNKIEVNDIRSVYPRNNTQIIRAIATNQTLYLNKEKTTEWLNRQQFNSAEATQLIDSTTKIIQNFENPKINAQKNINQENATAENSQNKEIVLEKGMEVRSKSTGETFTLYSLSDNEINLEKATGFSRVRQISFSPYSNIEELFNRYDFYDFNGEKIEYSEKSRIFIQENNVKQLIENENSKRQSENFSTSEPVGRETPKSNDRELDTQSQSEQARNHSGGQGMDSHDAGNGLSQSERGDLGRGGSVGTTLLGTQQSSVEGTRIIHEEGHRGTEGAVRGSESAEHNNFRGEQNQADNGGGLSRAGGYRGVRPNVGERDGARDEGIPQNQNTTSERLAVLIQEIKKHPKPTNEQITEVVNLATSVSSEKTIELKEIPQELQEDLKNIISQYKSGGIAKKGRGVLDEYYTDIEIVTSVHNLIKDNFKGQGQIQVLEPSVGIGNFLYASEELGVKTQINAFEINETTAKIAKILHPNAIINLRSFETEFIDDNGQKKSFAPQYDLVIGNPPYGQHRGYYYGLGEESKISRYEDYFVKRSLDVLKEGGTLAMVLPSSYLNRQNKLNNAEMVQAFRLPNGVFKGTDVATDILILKKNSHIQNNDISNYFNLEENQKRVLGEIGIKTNRYGREESYVKGDLFSALTVIQEISRNNLKIQEREKEPIQLDLFSEVNNSQSLEVDVNAKNGKDKQQKEEPSKQNENAVILAKAKGKVENALNTLENIKFKSFSVVQEIEKYSKLKIRLEEEPNEFSQENLEEISQKADNIIKLQKKQDKEYLIQNKPEIKKGVLKYIFEKKDNIVETAIQNNSQIQQEQIEAFTNTRYDGELLIHDEKLQKYANYQDGVWIHDFYYQEGNIYDKLEQLEEDKEKISEAQYEKQKSLLESVLPKKKSLDEIIIAPNHEFVHSHYLDSRQKEYYNYSTKKYETKIQDYYLSDKFKDFIHTLPQEAFGSSDRWEVRAFVDNESVTGGDAKRNALVRERRKEVANDLFNKFLREELTDAEKEKFVSEFNRRFNNIYVPDYSQFPLFSKIHQNFKGSPLRLTEVQKAGIGRLTTKGVGLLAHEVGFGKTLSGVLSMHEAMERENAKRPLIVVPNNNILKQWVETIFETIPNAKVNVLGNLGKDYDLSKFDNKDGEITLVTYEGFNNIGFSKETTDRLANKFSYISKQEIKGLRNAENDSDKIAPYAIIEDSKSERDIQKEIAQEAELKGKMKKGKVYDWEDFGFDHLTFDEVHNANHIVGKVKIEDRRFASDFRSQNQRTSALGINTWMAAQYIQEQNDGRNVTLLSATPFTNKPLEYYSILSLIANKRLEKSGYFHVNNFFETFMEADNEMEIDATGGIKNKTNIRRFKNNALFQQLLSEFIDIKGEEDNPELKRPNRINKEYKIEQNNLTIEQYDLLNENYDESQDGAILTHILNARLTAISPYLSPYYEGKQPTAKEFVENSPKLKTTMDLIAQNKKDEPNAGQIIYSELAVNEFPKLKEYLVQEVGFKEKEVALITGATSKNQRIQIQEDFNEGKIKVIIGSSAIQEGMNLQEKTSDMYLLSLPYNFTSLRQTEGRAWRQGNQWENVRINFMLTNDSIDVFMLQKLQVKQARYMEAMKKDVDILDVSDINTAELKTAIITNPTTRAGIEIEVMRKRLEEEKTRLIADGAFSSRKMEKYYEARSKEKRIEDEIKQYEEWSKDGGDYWKDRAVLQQKSLAEAKAETEKVLEKLRKTGIDVDGFQKKQAILEEKVKEIDLKIEGLGEVKSELEQKYIAEKEKQLQQNKDYDYVAERAQENKTFYKLREVEQQQKQRGFKR